MTNNNRTFLRARRTMSFKSTCDASVFLQRATAKMSAKTKAAAVMTTLVIEKMRGLLLKIWRSKGTLKL